MNKSSSCSWFHLKEKRLTYGVFVGSLFMAFTVSIVFKSYSFTRLSIFHDAVHVHVPSQSSMDDGNRITTFKDTRPLQKLGMLKLQYHLKAQFAVRNSMLVSSWYVGLFFSDFEVEESSSAKPICNCESMSNYCKINGDVVVQGNSSTISMVSIRTGVVTRKISWTVKPYVRKENAAAMDLVKSWSVTSTEFVNCDVTQNVPAILFSLGGFSGNHFHDFSDLVIPLYITSKQFNGEVQFLVTDNRPWWITKYEKILKKLSRYDIIDIDRESKPHCYPRMILGLKYHKELGIDRSKSRNQPSMNDFRQFLRTTYTLKRAKAINTRNNDAGKRPRLLIITRRRSRSFTNINKITRMATSLGYNVLTTEPNISTSLASVAETVNSCDVLMGIHGAGLTNMVFLPDNAVVIQIVPLGCIDGLARQDFAAPAMDMKLRYLEYKIKAKESSLRSKYKADHMIIKDPLSVHKKGWEAVKSTYLDKQNVKVDVRRFRATLLKALHLLR